MSGSLRVVGASTVDLTDWRDPLPAGKWSQFFTALGRRTEIVDIVRGALPRHEEALNYIRHVSPRRAAWIARAGFAVGYADRISAVVQRELERHAGSFDLTVQLQTKFDAAGAGNAPYVIYTDNTFALTQRIYPAWAPLSPRRVSAWLDYEARVSQRAAAVFTFSEFARRSMVEDYGCPPEQVRAIGAGANQWLESVDDKDYRSPRALFVGRPFGLKGGETLLNAWSRVRRELPEAELVIAGPRGDPPRRLGPGVVWRGRVDRATLAELYRDATLFVLPSLFEAWGHVLVEAMGHGLPCVALDAYAMPEIVADGVTGRLVPRADADALADALITLLSDATQRATLGHAAHRRVLSGMTWDHVAGRLVEGLPDDLRRRARAS